MPSELTNVAWAQIRHDYEHTERPVADICAEHGISSGTLRNRVHRWGWTRRRPPIPLEGPPPSSAPAAQFGFAAPMASPPIETAPPPGVAAPAKPDDRPIAERLQGAVARVLPAIESIVATLGPGPMPPREMERAARSLTALTRTLRELNNLLGQRQAAAPNDTDNDDDMSEDIDAFRLDLARRIDAFVASRSGETNDGPSPEGN
jgi:hypothetical protein